MNIGLDLKPFMAGVDALVRMADSLERIANVAEFFEDTERSKHGMTQKRR